MATPLSVTHEFSAAPEKVYALITDRTFLEGRLAETGGTDPSVVSLEVTDDTATVVTQQSIPSSAMPAMVASLINGDPVTVRTENWRSAAGQYIADFSVVIQGAPASLKGTMTLAATETGSSLAIAASALVPIPLFGGKVEAIVVEQVQLLLDREDAYTEEVLTR